MEEAFGPFGANITTVTEESIRDFERLFKRYVEFDYLKGAFQQVPWLLGDVTFLLKESGSDAW